MMKKILASLMAVLMAFGVCTIIAAAEEPETPEAPAYTPVEYQIADLVAAAEGKGDVYLQPTDVILLPEAEQETPAEETPDPAAGTAEPAAKAVLIVEYLPGKDAVSGNENTRYVDYDGSGYAICALGDYTDYAFKGTERRENYAIDYVNENEYAFKQWKVKSIYSGKEFSRIVLVAEWDEPALTGWAGYKTLMRGYIKTVIDYIIEYLKEWFAELGAFLVGTPA
jgi:hypothetical protein